MSSRESEAARIFLQAVERYECGQWAAFVREAAAGDPFLWQRVDALLRAHGESNHMLDGGGLIPTEDIAHPGEEPGTQIGPYKLLEQIGEGGFGIVFMAEQQQPVRRKVALKVLKPGMDTRQVVARFEAERQALAIMDHPNIARVFDGGATPSGRPYFVMELVKGVPITEFCDKNQLTLRQRLELFVHVCQAVQHAHQKGIIHRDLKPSNVLISRYDTTPVVKVIDFGVAKALGQELTDKTLFTSIAQMIGTPMYMSPEQAGRSDLDIDTRSDIYSLGVLLYELLTGTTPFTKERFKQASYDEIRRIIREEEPPKPSMRFSTLGEAATEVTAQRRSDPKRLRQLCRGELDWIVMKALEKDRNRRYETANGLVRDVQRYLDDEPVQACPPSRWYRLRKFALRNKGALGMAATLALAVVAAVVVLAVSNVYISWEKQLKEIALQNAETAEALASRRLFDALLAQARGLRHGGSVGSRSESLKALDEAAALAPTLDLSKDHLLDLRNETIACLCQTNLRLERQWQALGPTSRGLVLDADLRLYARGDSSGGEQGDISVRRVEDDREVVRLGGAVNLADDRTHFKFSPDGTRLAVVEFAPSFGSQATVWDLNRSQYLLRIANVWQLEFHPKAQLAAVAHTDGSIRLYDLSTGKQDGGFEPKLKGYTLWLCFNAQGTKLAVASDGNPQVQVWDTATSSLEKRVNLPEPVWDALAWHPGGRLLAIAARNRIYLHDLDAGRQTILEGHQHSVTHLAFRPSGDLLASMSWDATARLWDTRTGRQILWTPASPRPGPLFSRDGRRLALRYGRTAKVFEIDRSAEYRAFRSPLASSRGHGEPLRFSLDGRLLCVAGDKGIRFWDTATGETSGLLPPPGFRSMLFDPAGKRLITTGPCGVHLWPMVHDRRAEAIRLRIGPPQAVAAAEIADAHFLALSRDGRTLVVSTEDRRAAVVDVPARKVMVWLTGQRNLIPVAISPGGRWVATAASWGDEVVVWDAKTGKRLKSWPHLQKLSGRVTFSPDGKWLVTTFGPDYRLIETGSWELRRIISTEGSGEIPASPQFSDDGKILAIADVPDRVKLLDPDTDQEYASLSVPGGLALGSLCFNPNGNLLAVNTLDGLVHVWDLRRIRQRLAGMNLDWGLPPLPPPPGDAAVPVRLEVELGELTPARQLLARSRRALEANPDNAAACNDMAWIFAAGPTDVRNPKEALRLAQKAVGLDPTKHDYLHTLSVAYYRLGRWREALATLEDAVKANGGSTTAYDLYFLAMCYQKLGEPKKARDYYDRANAWWQAHPNLPPEWVDELESFCNEAATLLGLPGPAPRP